MSNICTPVPIRTKLYEICYSGSQFFVQPMTFDMTDGQNFIQLVHADGMNTPQVAYHLGECVHKVPFDKLNETIFSDEKIAESVVRYMNDHKYEFINITETIKQFFNQDKFDVINTYFNSCDVVGKEEETRIHIRYEYKWNIGIFFNISSIEIDENKRRRGYFRDFMMFISKRCKDIHMLKIGGVCTDEMRQWCNKYEFRSLDGLDFVLEPTAFIQNVYHMEEDSNEE